jgi:hypothetical protein
MTDKEVPPGVGISIPGCNPVDGCRRAPIRWVVSIWGYLVS